ncbi:MAG: endo-1,4-beta-xylanase [Oscillospiraceae bacterium]|nr:endo-1,4-beta-xylanase [Oscillospiraceae bacterium]
MTKRISALLCAIMLFSAGYTTSEAYAAGYINVCGEQIRLAEDPIISNDNIYYPIGEVAQILGMTADKNSDGSIVTVSVNEHTAEFSAGSETAVMDLVTIPVSSLFGRGGDVFVEEAFFLNYMKYMGFPCEKNELLTFTSLPEIIVPVQKETEDEFYTKLERDGVLITEDQLYKASVVGGRNLEITQVQLDKDEIPNCDKALQIKVLNEPTAIYDYQLRIIPKADIPPERFGVVSYWAKAVDISDETGYAYVGPCYEQNFGDYKKAGVVNQEIEPDGSWKKYYMLLSSKDDSYLASNSRFNMRFGYKPQTVMIAGLRVELLKSDYTKDDVTYLPTTENTYRGREDNALWRDEAFKRIEQNRKADISVNIRNEEGEPIENVGIKAEMIKNEFLFGTAVHNTFLQSGTSENAKRYAQEVQNHFNTVVYDTAGKWPTIEENRAVYASGIYNWANERNINVRGHTLFWDNLNYYSDSFKQAWNYMSNDERFYRVKEHINSNMTYFGNRIPQWDLLNEPLANRNLLNMIGVEKAAELFKLAKKIAPEVSLYVNETGINGNHSNWFQVRKLKSLITKLTDNGAPIDGIGIQAHCGTALRYPQEFYNQLDFLVNDSNVNEIAVTEYDFTTDDETLASDNLRDMLIAAYSHPKATAFLTWGFWDKQHWKKNAPFFYDDWSEKEALQVWDHYVNGEWKTSVSGSSNSDGLFSFRGHKGEYLLTVTVGGRESSAVFDTRGEGVINVTVGDVITILPDSVPDKKAELNQNDYLKYRSDYSVLKDGEITGSGALMPVYQQPEEYDQSIIIGKTESWNKVDVTDNFDDYGIDGKDENGRYINPVTNENVLGKWYGLDAYDKRGTVIQKIDDKYCLSFARQMSPEVVRSSISRILKPNGFPIDMSDTAYSFKINFNIPYENGAIGIRYGRYAEFSLARTADGTESETIAGIYSNNQSWANPVLKYGPSGKIVLDENKWYELSLTIIPKGNGSLKLFGILKSDGKALPLITQDVCYGEDLRFLNVDVKSYTDEGYTRRVFDLDAVSFKETVYKPYADIEGKNIIFSGNAGLMAAAAVYDKESGALLEVKTKTITEDYTPTVITLDTELNRDIYVKAFLWANNMSPAVQYYEWREL